jgi:hypothetical protein
MPMGILILLTVALTCITFALAPGKAVGIFQLQVPALRWARVIGFLGLAWVVLALTASHSTTGLSVPSTAKPGLDIARHYLGGAIVGLIIGLGTKRRANPK